MNKRIAKKILKRSWRYNDKQYSEASKRLQFISAFWKHAAVGMTTHMIDNFKRYNETNQEFTKRMRGEYE